VYNVNIRGFYYLYIYTLNKIFKRFLIFQMSVNINRIKVTVQNGETLMPQKNSLDCEAYIQLTVYLFF
jgi:hypothetical protein